MITIPDPLTCFIYNLNKYLFIRLTHSKINITYSSGCSIFSVKPSVVIKHSTKIFHSFNSYLLRSKQYMWLKTKIFDKGLKK
jgi:hypothetical protein